MIHAQELYFHIQIYGGWGETGRGRVLSGFGKSAVYIPLVGQVVQHAVVSQRNQLGIEGSLLLFPVLLFLLLLSLALLVAAFIFLHLQNETCVQLKPLHLLNVHYILHLVNVR